VLSCGVCNLVEDVNVEDLVLVVNFHCPTKLIYCGTLASLKRKTIYPKVSFSQ
jgi:hypothetical protein